MKTKTYYVDDRELNFSKDAFSTCFMTYYRKMGKTKNEAMYIVGDAIGSSFSTVENWLKGKNAPMDIDTVKSLASAIGISNYQILLTGKKEEDKMKALNERQVTAVKKIYDSCIAFLHEFNSSDGFNDYVFTCKDHNDVLKKIDELKGNVDLVLDQEYFDLKDADIYDELCEFVSEDLIDIYDGKTCSGYRVAAPEDGNPTTSDDYNKAMIRLNQIIDKYI